MNDLPPALQRAVADEVGGEKLLWCDSPDPRACLLRVWHYPILAVPPLGMGLFLIRPVLSGLSQDNWAGVLFGLLFLYAAIPLLRAPIIAYRRAKRTAYVITERRAVIVVRTGRQEIRSFSPQAVSRYVRRSRGGESGDILFEQVVTRQGRHSRSDDVGFLDLRKFAPAVAALDEMLARAIPASGSKS
ncbi:MAG: hypothetical protein JNL39_13725 [Opitutaceae bacterium]|nr:hypothetical protein [Opitutaceae bacterium]